MGVGCYPLIASRHSKIRHRLEAGKDYIDDMRRVRLGLTRRQSDSYYRPVHPSVVIVATVVKAAIWFFFFRFSLIR